MITIPVHIKECSDINFVAEKQQNYSFAFRKLYAGYHKNEDKKFADFLQRKFKLTDIEFRSLQSDVANKYEQTKTNKSQLEERIMDIMSDKKVSVEQGEVNKSTRTKFKKHNKLKQLESALPRNITFGGKETLRKITKLYNNIQVINREVDVELKIKLLAENQLKIDEQKEIWKQNRILQFYILGEANRAGNRFFNFDFANNLIVYKPFKGKKIEIKYSCGKKYQNKLIQLQELINSKSIAVTMSVSTEQVCISFDNEVLSGFSVDKQERRKEVAEVNKKEISKESKKEIINAIYVKHYDSLRVKQLEGKIPNRFMAIDINPDCIGYCIADRGVGGIEEVIEKGVVKFNELNKKLNLPSDHPLVKKQNNKRKHEVINSIKMLAVKAKHLKVAYFVREDVNNISKNESLGNKEANRKVKNIWHREITDWQISKRCTELGIQIIDIIPAYTSFIGNLIYSYFDATNASLEICRRGMFKYTKEGFYPQITGTIFDTMSKLFECQGIQLKPRDARIFKDCTTWNKLYKIASDNGLRWRWGWDKVEKPFSTFSMDNIKSKVQLIRFT